MKFSSTASGWIYFHLIGRGIGAAATAISSLGLGYMIANLGTTWMLIFVLCAWILFAISLMGYPAVAKPAPASADLHKSSNVLRFFRCYPRYCSSLVGIMFLGMYHVMTETYMIAIVSPLGGNSSHVGTALFISAIVTFPVIFFFSKIRSRLRDISLLKIAAVSYVLKAICFYFAKDINAIYLFQLLQITSYAFLEPTQVYYAKSKVRHSDITKGQAFITAAYALGSSIGNFAGGRLLTFGINTFLVSGIIMSTAGAVILFLTANKTDPQ